MLDTEHHCSSSQRQRNLHTVHKILARWAKDPKLTGERSEKEVTCRMKLPMSKKNFCVHGKIRNATTRNDKIRVDLRVM